MFWLSLGKIVWIDILLSGDNALVIAMVCRGLPPGQRLWGMILGAGGAIAARVLFTGIAAEIMYIPYLQLVGGLALLAVAIKLIWSSDDGPDHQAASTLWAAIGTIMVADASMSLDNVIAVAAASHGDIILLAIGLALSIPLIVTGASVIVMILNKFPLLIWAGAGLLGWIAGEIIAEDAVMAPLSLQLWLPITLASIVILTAVIRQEPQHVN